MFYAKWSNNLRRSDKVKKYYLVAGLVLTLLAVASFLIAGSIPSTITRETDLLKYSQTGKFAYLINLKPSYLYGPIPQSPVPDPRYPLVAVGTIDFTYSFSPIVKSQQSTYVEAVLENPGIWQKRVTILPEAISTGEFTRSFSLDPGRMNALFDGIEKETGIKATPRSLHVDVVIETANGLIVQSLPLSLDANLIKISSNLNQILPEGTGKFYYTLNRQMTSTSQPLPAAKYPAAVVNTLDFTFSYQPAISGMAAVSIDAVLANSDIWQKTVTLVAEKPISGNMPLKFSLSLDSLVEQFNEIDEVTRLTTSPRLVTLKASVVQGNNRFVQSLPFTIDDDILEIPGDLQSTQKAGSGTFDYVLNLKPNTLFSTSTLRPPQLSLAPDEILSPSYDINTDPGLQPAVQPATVLGPDQTAFTKLIDKMNVTMNYQFQSDQAVNSLNTDVNIRAVIEAPNVWSRTINLLDTNKSGNFSLAFPIDMTGYNALVQAINTETGVSPSSVSISIIAALHTTGVTSSGKIDSTFSPTLKGTIAGNVLQWNKELTTSRPGSIKISRTIANPSHYLGLSAGWARNLSLILAFGFIFLLGFLLMLYIRIKPTQNAPSRTNALRIKKKYGERLVKALDQTPPEAEKVVILDSMEDLVKVADELAKPIIYQTPGPSQEPYVYFVFDGTNRYQYFPNVTGQSA
jgi:hypothetical protein